MKRRILSLLLAMCLIVGLLPLTALAEDEVEIYSTLVVVTGNNTESIQWKPAMSEGMTPAYAKTTAEGALVLEGATEKDYNLKVEWPVGGTPTLTMNNATLVNDCMYDDSVTPTISVQHTVTIDGTADFQVMLKGTNTITGNYAQQSTTTSSYRMATGLHCVNTGNVTITSVDKTVDSLTIDNWGGLLIEKRYTELRIQDATVNGIMHNSSKNAQQGIIMAYTKAGCEDTNHLKVINSNFSIKGGTYYSNNMILLGKTNKYTADNTSDILFQNSVVSLVKSNGTSTSGTSSCGIYAGAASHVIVDNCDFTLTSPHRAVNYAPEFKNVTGVQSRSGWSTWSDFSQEAFTYLADGTGYSSFKCTHICKAGEPVLENKGTCAETADTVTYCTFCGKEMDRVETPLEPSKGHTPGEKVLVSGSMTKPTNQGHYSVTTKGTYTLQCTCSVCGETWTETVEYLPAVLYYVTASNDYESSSDKTVPKWKFGSYWGNQSTSYKPTKTVLPGDTLYYATEAGINANIPTNSYMRQLSTSNAADKAVIDAGTWNIKVEYPIGGTPVITMQDATIINCAGLWYGYAGFYNMAPMTLVLKGTNTIKQPKYTNGGALNLKTTSPVTITGDGTLELYAFGNYTGIRSVGDITFDHVNVTYTHTTSGSAADALACKNLTIDGGSFTMTGTAKSLKGECVNGFNTTGDITIKGGANVSLTNQLNTNDYYMLNAAGNITINESTLKLAAVYRGYLIKCGGELTMEYANGFTGKATSTYTALNTVKDENEVVIEFSYGYPDVSEADALTTKDQILANAKTHYMEIAPNKALANFTGTSVTVKEDLDVNFKLDADKVDADGTVKFTVDGEEISKPLSEVGKTEGADYVITLPGLPAKKMTTELTVTVYDAEGKAISETKSESVEAYALRLLRDNKYADDTKPENAALKKFVVDMLVYGSMAQVQFNNQGEEGVLPTAALNGKEWGYATAELANVPEATKPTGNGYVGTSFELKSDIGMAIALDAKVLTNVTKAVVSYTDYKGNPQTAEITVKDSTSNSAYTVFVYDKLTAANGRQDITWTFYNGEAVVLTVTDSLAAYVGRARTANPYLDELLKYCDSAAAYFTLINN